MVEDNDNDRETIASEEVEETSAETVSGAQEEAEDTRKPGLKQIQDARANARSNPKDELNKSEAGVVCLSCGTFTTKKIAGASGVILPTCGLCGGPRADCSRGNSRKMYLAARKNRKGKE